MDIFARHTRTEGQSETPRKTSPGRTWEPKSGDRGELPDTDPWKLTRTFSALLSPSFSWRLVAPLVVRKGNSKKGKPHISPFLGGPIFREKNTKTNGGTHTQSQLTGPRPVPPSEARWRSTARGSSGALEIRFEAWGVGRFGYVFCSVFRRPEKKRDSRGTKTITPFPNYREK